MAAGTTISNEAEVQETVEQCNDYSSHSGDNDDDDDVSHSSIQNGSIPLEEPGDKYQVYVDQNRAGSIQFKRPGKKKKTTESFTDIVAELSEKDISSVGGSDGLSLQFNIPNDSEPHSYSSLFMDKDLQKLVQLKALCFLDMTGVKLPDKNFEFGGLVNLTSLTLDDTNLRLLHPSIGRLINLSYMSLRFNRLYDFPVTIRLLQNLKYLNITGNLFRCLPSSVFHLNSLKTIEGLNENLLEQYPGWKKGEQLIASAPPLPKPNPPRETIDDLSQISLSFSVGLNIWLIPLPDKFREEITRRCITRDLCEECLAPVKKIMAEQESDGYFIKVCLDVFKQYSNVPFAFYACSKECNDRTMSRLRSLLNEQKRNTSSRKRKDKLEEVSLKPDYARPIRITRYSFSHGDIDVDRWKDPHVNKKDQSSTGGCNIS